MEFNQNNSAKKESEARTTHNRFKVQGQSQSQEKLGQPIKKVDKSVDSATCWEQIQAKCLAVEKDLRRERRQQNRAQAEARKQLRNQKRATATSGKSSRKTTVPNCDVGNTGFKKPSIANCARKKTPKRFTMSSKFERHIDTLMEPYEEPEQRGFEFVPSDQEPVLYCKRSHNYIIFE